MLVLTLISEKHTLKGRGRNMALRVSALPQLDTQQLPGGESLENNCTEVTARKDREKILFCYLDTLSYITILNMFLNIFLNVQYSNLEGFLTVNKINTLRS